ncbi:hypothetical protein [Curtobacterium sp. UCD-KPL2560]|uniref:hypothetical protein n=1 Tax=Curtobacterium sp. UCD-KPL2560 TaxID=1885315 RepID=UPI000826B577|nr:hypothetical protein [Curtobacterium sp. UCD-KPL2560]
MAIKERTPLTEEERAAKIAAFGDAATQHPDAPAETPGPASAARAPRTTKPAPKVDADKDLADTTLIRWPKDKELQIAVAQIAKEEHRSKHAMSLRLLRQGVDAYHAKQ